jgi:hypothetical protein
MAKNPPEPPPDPVAPPVVGEVRYSLPELLQEIEVERRDSSFAMETIEQVEIQKMFANRRRHARGKK